MSIEGISAISALGGSGKVNLTDVNLDMKTIEQIVASKDFNGDGYLNVHEVGFSDDLFEGMDMDADQKLSSTELLQGIQRYQENAKVFENILSSTGASQMSGTQLPLPIGNGQHPGQKGPGGIDQAQLLQTLANSPEAKNFMAQAAEKLQSSK